MVNFGLQKLQNKKCAKYLVNSLSLRLSNKNENASNGNDKKNIEWYRFPLGLFLVFNNIKPIIWTSASDTKFDYYISVPADSIHAIALYLKKHVFSNTSYLLDICYFSPSEVILNLGITRTSPDAIGI